MEQALEQFVDRLVEEKGFANVDPEVLAQVKADLTDRVEDHINAAILEHMPADKLQEFESKLNQGNTEEIRNYCAQVIPNLDEVVAEVLLNFRRTYLGL